MKTAISATINGAEYQCAIPRDNLKFFETMFGSAFAMYRRMTTGEWTASEVRAVITFATRPKISAAANPLAVSLTRLEYDDSNFVDDAFNERGPANYLPLAMGILAAALWGIPDEMAVFTDVADTHDGE